MNDLYRQSLLERFGQVTMQQHDNTELIRCVVSDLASELSRLNAVVAQVELERDDLKRYIGDEQTRKTDLRIKYGVRPDETFATFVQRLVAQRNAASADAGIAQSERNDARDIADSLQKEIEGWKNKWRAACAFREQENVVLRNKLTQAACEYQDAQRATNHECALWKAKFAESQRQVNELHSELIVLRRELDNDDREFADVYAAASAQVNVLVEKLKQSQGELDELRVNIAGAVAALDPAGKGDEYAMQHLNEMLLREAQTCEMCSRSALLENSTGGMLWCDEVNNACAAMGHRCGMWSAQPKSEGV